MLLDLLLFDKMFPTYSNYRIPMWSDWKEKDNKTILEIAMPGFPKENFNLSIEDGSLYLKILNKEKSITYSIIDKFHANAYKLEDASAKYVDGVLSITIPKTAKKVKKIEVEVS